MRKSAHSIVLVEEQMITVSGFLSFFLDCVKKRTRYAMDTDAEYIPRFSSNQVPRKCMWLIHTNHARILPWIMKRAELSVDSNKDTSIVYV